MGTWALSILEIMRKAAMNILEKVFLCEYCISWVNTKEWNSWGHRVDVHL